MFDGRMMGHVIFDIDGTLSDSSHRAEYARIKDWDTFNSMAPEDPVITKIADLLRLLSADCQIVLLTGRMEKYRGITEKWLKDSNLDFFCDHLLMRPNDDMRNDFDLKIAILENHFGSREAILKQVWFVVEDRDRVVEGMRNYGLTVLQPVSGAS
jgi:FMN phosphatase YigB (HAD superfamily)